MAEAPARAAEGLPIREVQVIPRNIFEPVPSGRLSPLFRLANRLHMRTRKRTIEEQLLFRTGDTWQVDRGRESVRNLRALDFLEPIKIDTHVDGDSVTVAVETRDVWSTQFEFNIESADGAQYGSVAFSERNFAGLGKSFSAAYRQLPSGDSRDFGYLDPGVLGSRARLRYSASNSTDGATDAVYLGVPFYSLETRDSYGVDWQRGTTVDHLFLRGSDVATFNRRDEQVEIFYGRGRRLDGVVTRAQISLEDILRRFGPTQASDVVPEEFLGGEESLRERRLSMAGRVWMPHYIERTRVDGFGRVEDFDVGQSLELKLGLAPEVVGSTEDEGYAQMRVGLGAVTPAGFGMVRAEGETRYRSNPFETQGRLDARWISQNRFGQTLVLAAHGAGAIDPSRDYQQVVGGLNGLRAYPVHAVAGRRLWRLNAEERWTVGENFWENLTLGGVAFFDAARAWGAGSMGGQWFVAAGGGLRVNLPQWSLGQVLRFDVAWPITPTRDGKRDPVLTFGSRQAF
jgi:hypothetical protein